MIDRRIVVAITGASGAAYAQRLLQCLADAEVDTHLVCSPHGRRLLNDELGITTVDAQALTGKQDSTLTTHSYRDIGAPLASGSFGTDGMIVCPCSGNTMAAIATGLGDNLITRAAAVTLKEARRLIVVPREMPCSRVDLENALRISQAGGIVCPASPGFYMLPKSIDDLVDMVVGKLLDLVGVPHQLNIRWKGSPSADESPA